MNVKVTTSCLLLFLGVWADAAESNLRGGSRSLAPLPEQFRLGGGEINALTTFQPGATPFQPIPTLPLPLQFGPETFPNLSFQIPTGVLQQYSHRSQGRRFS
jgi:hypothetical protein